MMAQCHCLNKINSKFTLQVFISKLVKNQFAMRTKQKYLVFIILALFLGCGPYIWFKVPQPAGGKNLTEFPDLVLGKYASLVDTNVIRIKKDKIIREYRENLLMTKIEFREEVGDTISEDTSFMFTDNWKIDIRSYGDSIKVFSSKDEELFKISEIQLLRAYKSYYFLNYKDTNDYWKVKILRLVGDTLEFDFILKEEDIKSIKGITKIKVSTDSIKGASKYFLDPTKRELRKILKQRKKGEKYVKSKM